MGLHIHRGEPENQRREPGCVICGFRELRGVISKVPRETDSDLRRWKKEIGWEIEKPGRQRRVGSGEAWVVEEEGGWEVEKPGMAEEVHPHERL